VALMPPVSGEAAICSGLGREVSKVQLLCRQTESKPVYTFFREIA
jgi:hypothetical protein